MAGAIKSKYLRFLALYAYLYALIIVVTWILDYVGIKLITVPLLVACLVVATALYHSPVVFKFVMSRLGRRTAYVIGVAFLSASMSIMILMTGGYASANDVGLVSLIFMSAMLGADIPIFLVWMGLLAYVLALLGLVPALGSTRIGAVVVLAQVTAGLVGWLVFRRFYVRQDQAAEELQRALTAEQLQSAAVLASINDSVAIINRDGVTRHANPRFLKMVAMSAEELVGKHYSEVASHHRMRISYSTSKTPRIAYNVAEVFKTGKSVEVDVETLEYADHRPSLDISLSVTPLKNDDGDISAVLIVAHDISGLMKVQRLKDNFIATASHELRTPLTVISGYSDLLLNTAIGYLTEKQRHYVERTKETSQLLTQLINNILDIGELESGRRTNKPETIVLSSFLETIVNEKTAHFAEKQLGLHVSSEPIKIYVDKRRLQQVLDCLLTNAYKFTPETGTVVVEAISEKDATTLISVSDTGPGVPQDKQDAIFGTFAKLDITGTNSGTGLGLAIAKKIVSDWGGTINVKNRPEGGACFYFTIPLQQPEPDGVS